MDTKSNVNGCSKGQASALRNIYSNINKADRFNPGNHISVLSQSEAILYHFR